MVFVDQILEYGFEPKLLFIFTYILGHLNVLNKFELPRFKNLFRHVFLSIELLHESFSWGPECILESNIRLTAQSNISI